MKPGSVNRRNDEELAELLEHQRRLNHEDARNRRAARWRSVGRILATVLMLLALAGMFWLGTFVGPP